MLDNQERKMLYIFMDLLRNLRAKVPALFERAGLSSLATSERFRHNVDVEQALTKPVFEPSVPESLKAEVCAHIVLLIGVCRCCLAPGHTWLVFGSG